MDALVRGYEVSRYAETLDALMIARLSAMKHRDEGAPLPPVGELETWEQVIAAMDRVMKSGLLRLVAEGGE